MIPPSRPPLPAGVPLPLPPSATFMRTLILFRHAKSDWPAGVPDHERPLGPRGVQAAPAMARWLAEHHGVPGRVLCSDATRTRETLALALEVWEAEGRAPTPEVSYHSALYLASPARMLHVLAEEGGAATRVMMVGHNPGTHTLADALARPGRSAAREHLRRDFPTAAMAVLTFDIAGWDDPAFVAGDVAGDLVAFQLPRALG